MAKGARAKQANPAVAALNAISDPTKRALAAAAELEQLREQAHEISRVRLAAIGELRAQGLSYQGIADLLGFTRERAAQLCREAKQLDA